VIVVDGERLTPVEITQLAYRLDHFVLAEAALSRVARSYEFGEQAAARRPIYGRSTGVGANRDAILVDPAAQAEALLRSHATTSGEPRSRERVRAMLAVRLNQLAAGGSGASPDVLRPTRGP
jgi:histidine ammonia-lyase